MKKLRTKTWKFLLFDMSLLLVTLLTLIANTQQATDQTKRSHRLTSEMERALHCALMHHDEFDVPTKLIHFKPGVVGLFTSDPEINAEYIKYRNTAMFESDDELFEDLAWSEEFKLALSKIPFTNNPSLLLFGYARFPESVTSALKAVVLRFFSAWNRIPLSHVLPAQMIVDFQTYFTDVEDLPIEEGLPADYPLPARPGFAPLGHFSCEARTLEAIGFGVFAAEGDYYDFKTKTKVTSMEIFRLIPERKAAVVPSRGDCSSHYEIFWGRSGEYEFPGYRWSGTIWEEEDGTLSDQPGIGIGFKFFPTERKIICRASDVYEDQPLLQFKRKHGLFRGEHVSEVVDLDKRVAIVTFRSNVGLDPPVYRHNWVGELREHQVFTHVIFDLTEAEERVNGLIIDAKSLWAAHSPLVHAFRSANANATIQSELACAICTLGESGSDILEKERAVSFLLKYTERVADIGNHELLAVLLLLKPAPANLLDYAPKRTLFG